MSREVSVGKELSNSQNSSVCQANGFDVVAVLGRGACSTVCAANNNTGNGGVPRRVALKLFRKNAEDETDEYNERRARRIAVEHAILTRLQLVERHPFIVNVISAFQTPRYAVFAMTRYVTTLKALLVAMPRSKLPSEQAARTIAAEVLLALEFLHSNGIVYRDLKPENLLVGQTGHVALSDFDLSLILPWSPVATIAAPASLQEETVAVEQGDSSLLLASQKEAIASVAVSSSPPLVVHHSQTSSGPASNSFGSSQLARGSRSNSDTTRQRRTSLVGTTEYMAPETIGDGPCTPAVDMWGLGVLIYEMVFGRVPFNGTCAADTTDRITRATKVPFPVDPPASEALRSLLQALLSQDPQRRPLAAAVKLHPWFAGVDFGLLPCQLSPLGSRELPDDDQTAAGMGADRETLRGWWEAEKLDNANDAIGRFGFFAAARAPVETVRSDDKLLQAMQAGGCRSVHAPPAKTKNTIAQRIKSWFR